ncbi:hypothetical protein FACS1894160_1160 [Bacteroidia bacterium]|nr:hypothetical protein FACS1894160_1160 [Bacteroidia bacterium]
MKQLQIDKVLSKTLPAQHVSLVKSMIAGKLVTGGRSVNEKLEESEKDFLHYQKAKVNNLLKPVESSWEERRNKNISNVQYKSKRDANVATNGRKIER